MSNPIYITHHANLVNTCLKRGLTQKESVYVANRITNAYREINDPCCNLFRLSIEGDNDVNYAKIKAQGCCGYHDDTIELKSGKTVKFGFNFGH